MLAALLAIGPVLHNGMAFVFTLALAVTFLIWLRHSFPGWRDAVWLGKAGGMLIKGSTPAAWKFNAGQKILFWLVVLGGIGMIATGAGAAGALSHRHGVQDLRPAGVGGLARCRPMPPT